ncbi:unnamed protein product [Phytophthora lilii]|uniref:Unnamed protein product n=1 Tax=Phytophthora lilii TaxID=2077276 RepID=A0A9W6WR30_9STRA|nr:unnamed protein product [Phytophthora lilii]
MDKLFQDKLKMDLKIEDTEARILNYFVLFDQIVEDHGLGGILDGALGYYQASAQEGRYCSLVERAREQELKHGEKTRAQSKGSPVNTKRPANPKSTAQQTASPIGKHPEGAKPGKFPENNADPPRPPPRDGCLLCSGAHWVKDCPTATATEREEALKRVSDLKNQRLRAKAVRSMVAPGDRPAILNGVLEVPFRADTGADYNVITRHEAGTIGQLCCRGKDGYTSAS